MWWQNYCVEHDCGAAIHWEIAGRDHPYCYWHWVGDTLIYMSFSLTRKQYPPLLARRNFCRTARLCGILRANISSSLLKVMVRHTNNFVNWLLTPCFKRNCDYNSFWLVKVINILGQKCFRFNHCTRNLTKWRLSCFGFSIKSAYLVNSNATGCCEVLPQCYLLSLYATYLMSSVK